MTDPSDVLSPEEFAAEFEAASRKLWCLASAILGDRSQAEDVVQEAAVTALGRLQCFKRGSNFLAWMGRIVRFTAYNRARRSHRVREVGPELLTGAADTGAVVALPVGADGQVEQDQAQFDDAVLNALGQLATLARASFLLRTVAELSYAEISELLEIPEGTAMSHVHRSRVILRQALEADGAFEVPAMWRAS